MIAQKDYTRKMHMLGCVPGINCNGDMGRHLGKLTGSLVDAKRLVGKQRAEWKTLTNRIVR